MQRALKKKSDIYAYLDQTKILETAKDDGPIDKAKAEYWKRYKQEWRKNQRKNTTQFTIAFNPSEAKEVLDAAKRHKRSRSAFIKHSCLSYINQRFLAPDIIVFGEIRQLLYTNYNALKKMFDQGIVPYQTGKSLMEQMEGLEQSIMMKLHQPKSLEKWIEESVRTTPQYKETLIELLQNIQV